MASPLPLLLYLKASHKPALTRLAAQATLTDTRELLA
jgi:hypothetical protein